MGAALKFKQAAVPRQGGETGRLRVIQGPDLGSTFVLRSHRIKIGRGEENDVVLSDLKASRTHVQLDFENGEWLVKDLGSSNGIWINEQPFRAGKLKGSDVVRLGDTSFEFITGDSPTVFLVRTPKSLDELESERVASKKHLERVRSFGRISGEKAKSTSLLLLGVLGLVGV